MKKKKGFFIWKQKSYVIAGLLVLIAVVAMAGMTYREKEADTDDAGQENTTSYLSEDAGQDVETMAEEAGQSAESAADSQQSADMLTEDTEAALSGSSAQDGAQTASPDAVRAVIEEIYPEDSDEESAKTLYFPGEGALLWPVSGNVIMDYSMDRTIYFATLDQYRNNPAIMIQGEVNDPVAAACAGQIIEISTNEVTGCEVVMDAGDGYQVVYGQLKEVEWETGDFVEAGEIIGYLSEPTKYFVIEGCNLYFQITMNGEPVNPLIYLGQDENNA